MYICTIRMPARPRRIVCATIYYIDRSSSNTIEFQASVLRFLRSQPTTCLAGRPPHSLTSLARPPRAVGATPAASTTTAWRPSWRTRPQPHQTTLNFIHEMKLERHKTRARGCHILRSQWRQCSGVLEWPCKFWNMVLTNENKTLETKTIFTCLGICKIPLCVRL